MNMQIVPDRWVTRETLRRPKARFFGFAAVVWAAVAFIGATMLWYRDATAGLSDIDRMAWFLVVPEPLFITLAIFFRLTERPRRVIEHVPTDSSGPIIP